ncbi:MAG: tetraacyldisaccharide 4'-kinase [Bdellovibrionaceae bacterium]|nr:tetraacyldisaccharide 4'-kinase [Bdellovibrionales bacterium]MCB9253465.1 tetraacyldisaccharide 4'-kinase [Pseudobdellovibrionaceae bacterium]
MVSRTQFIRRTLWIVWLPLALFWALAARLRRRRRGSYRSSLKVLCIGNLHSGGSGKTPVVRAVCEGLKGVRPAVLSRGYHGRLSAIGARVDSTGGPVDFGDEPWMLAQVLQCPVYIGADRAAMAKRMESEGLCDLIVMDDGFQNLSLCKDKSLLVFNAEKDLDSLYCLPLGELREPLSAIRHADGVVITYERDADLKRWENWLRELDPEKSFFPARRLYGPPRWSGGNTIESPYPSFLAFCGLADPRGFFRHAESALGAIATVAFPDHHVFTETELTELWAEASRVGATELLCTEKESHKIKSLLPNCRQPSVVRLSYEFPEEFWYFLRDI